MIYKLYKYNISKIYKSKGFMIYILFIFLVIAGLMLPLIINQTISSSWLYKYSNKYNTISAANSGIEDAKYQLQTYDNYPNLTSCTNLNLSYINNTHLLNYIVTPNNNISPNPKLAFTTLDNNLDLYNNTNISVINSNVFNQSGVILINKEQIYYKYNDTANNQLLYLTRGYNNTIKQNHAINSKASIYNCEFISQGFLLDQSANNIIAENNINSNTRLNTIYTAGNNGITAVWNYPIERAWNNIITPDNTNINSIDFINYTDGFAVGDSINSDLNIKYWDINNQNWININHNLNLNQDLNNIYIVNNQEAWAVGNSGDNNYTIIKYLGNNINDWCIVPSNTANISGTNNCINASTISNTTNIDSSELNNIRILDTNNDNIGDFGFVIGLVKTSNSSNTSNKSNNNPNKPNNPNIPNVIPSVTVATSLILQYNNNQFTESTNNSNTSGSLNSLYITRNPYGTPLEAYAVGSNKANTRGIILKWDNISNSWNEHLTNISRPLNSLDMLDINNNGEADFGIAVGNNGLVLIYNNNNWIESNITNNNLYDIKISSNKDAWVVGENGFRAHYNGLDWVIIQDGVNYTESLKSISVI